MTARKKILIAEDEEDIAWALSRSLSRSNYNFDVHCAKDGDEALRLLGHNRFDLVISDIRMPGLNGIELSLKVRKDYPHAKMIIMTAYGTPQIFSKADQIGIYFYIEKPFDVAYFRQVICEALGLRKKRLQGSLTSLGVADLVKLNCSSNSSTFISIHNQLESGNIYFKDGDVIHAECGRLTGEHAFYRLLNWGTGEFSVDSISRNVVRTISRDWKCLLHQSI